jgi:hypothetical protein
MYHAVNLLTALNQKRLLFAAWRFENCCCPVVEIINSKVKAAYD